ncbi:LuxR C-terminal-related transcriptional regulator [Gordonia terrae]|uniref:helix-turn-helix transcriptional regulator n=1 Tax=Gordonia terrae TaxID=2055 RepID=UPI00200B8438|nr:LuxR family transcriptional regulator [Gordonia terrae]UPW08508.1 LuxR C-terminal-related transcriptional regulator [Gordonia terrae]
MSSHQPAGSDFDLAVTAILDAPDRARLATAVCEGVARSVSASVALVEVGTAESVEIARSGSDDTAVAELSATAETTTTFTVQSQTTLVVHRMLDEDEREICRFLIDLAEATLARLRSDDLVADHHDRVRRLGDRLRHIGIDPVPELSDGAAASDLAVAASLLTQREREVLEQVVAGESNAAIAEKYTLSIETVKTHVKHILRKMGATNRAELIARSM